ncbi:DLGAP1 [Branchiostoma lanceolatum]|uniref:DLGAP1 protein n=1 Tax=Branchiostoma lanceolatum TaxID=7740 RepID=A0A8J9ZTD0_BRALA|nr:DLGAP1 [Branchiostoma lanceolatum]
MGFMSLTKHGLGLVLLASVGALSALYVSWKCTQKEQKDRKGNKGTKKKDDDGAEEALKLDDVATGDAITDKVDDSPVAFVAEPSCGPAAYLQRVQEERARLTGRCDDAEKYQCWNLSSDVLERVRSAIGQSILLTTNKKSTMATFEELCRVAMAPGGDNPYRPTMNDLAAFWDLVEKQVKNIDRLFDEVHRSVEEETA